MARSITIKDLAAELGLSPSTIARALADHPRISRATKARVQDIACARGYIAHSAARLMRSGRSTLVGLIVPDIQNDFYATVAKAMAECCHAGGYQLVLANTEDDPETELDHVRSLFEARVAGVAVVTSPKPTKETLGLLRRLHCVQLLRRVPKSGEGSWFGIDDRDGVRQAAAHLLALGHRRIAYIGGSHELSTGRARFAGYREAIETAGLEMKEGLVALGRPRAAFSETSFGAIWRGAERPTAVVTGGTRITIGLLQAIDRLAIRVPEDLSVIGFGDAPWFHWWGPGLTTLALPAREVAFACGDFLLRRIVNSSPENSEPSCQAEFRPTLVIRNSTAPNEVSATKNLGVE